MTDLTPDVRVKPRCRHLVGFSAGKENLDGVLGVTKGMCAIAIWFTLDPTHKEHTVDTAETLLTARSSQLPHGKHLSYFVFNLKHLLPARASEQGNVIGLVSVYIYIYIYIYIYVIKKKL